MDAKKEGLLLIVRLLFILLVLHGGCQLSGDLRAQDSSSHQMLLQLSYGAAMPMGLMANRFGIGFRWGASAMGLSPRGFTYGAGYTFMFGPTVKEDVVAPLRGPEGFIIGNDMEFASLFLRMRARYIFGQGGYFLDKPSARARRGLILGIGGGYFSHRIRFVDDFDSVVQLSSDAKKGYDRLTGGPAIHQQLGYQHLGHDGLLNFSASITLVEAFTRSLRRFNYDTGLPDSQSRLDLLMDIQVSWLIPIGASNKPTYY
ncbi:MAG: hypothetical protein KTR24_06875 [Saprospiraceae bacterium]|nr:hypothetical protein [Saprospiraceae bacterium]